MTHAREIRLLFVDDRLVVADKPSGLRDALGQRVHPAHRLEAT